MFVDYRKSGAMLNVTVSELRFDRPTGTKYPVTSIFLHPEYHDSNHTNNIALVKVDIFLSFKN